MHSSKYLGNNFKGLLFVNNMDTGLYIEGKEHMAITIFKELWMELEKLLKLRTVAHDLVKWGDGTTSWVFVGGKYKAANVWSAIRPRKEKVTWFKLVWHSLNVPKHVFISWLAILNRLPTKDRMKAWGWR